MKNKRGFLVMAIVILVLIIIVIAVSFLFINRFTDALGTQYVLWLVLVVLVIIFRVQVAMILDFSIKLVISILRGILGIVGIKI